MLSVSICCLFAATSSVFASRKYDIEAESLKLYKEHFQSVLQRFRRTPEYLKILEDKNAEHTSFLVDTLAQITYYYMDQLKHAVAKRMGLTLNKDNKIVASTQTPAPQGRTGADIFRRAGAKEPHKKSPVERLDSYNKLYSLLTLAERNAMKELGFQFAGEVIHELIKSLGPDRNLKSTRQPYDDPNGKVETTTEHMSVHKVTNKGEKQPEDKPETGKKPKKPDARANPETAEKPEKSEKDEKTPKKHKQ